MTLRFAPDNNSKNFLYINVQKYFTLFFQVFSKGPDDKLYNERQDLRENVARGNTILYIHNQETNVMHYDGVVFALRKFTGKKPLLKKLNCSPKKLVKSNEF